MRILIVAALALACAHAPKERKDATVTLTPVYAKPSLAGEKQPDPPAR